MLIEAGLLDESILYLSRSIIARKNDYYRLLRAVTSDGAWHEWTGGRDSRLIDVLFEQPYCRIASVVERCQVSRQTASGWLHDLVGAGLLVELKVGRELVFVNHEFMTVLTRPD